MTMKDINRLAFIHQSAMVFLAAATLLGAGANALAENRDTRKPNILLIMTDQQHAGMMSCAGNPWLKTPALDKLAAEGTRYEKAYAGNPVCCPSRTAVMSGLLPTSSGIYNNSHWGSSCC